MKTVKKICLLACCSADKKTCTFTQTRASDKAILGKSLDRGLSTSSCQPEGHIHSEMHHSSGHLTCGNTHLGEPTKEIVHDNSSNERLAEAGGETNHCVVEQGRFGDVLLVLAQGNVLWIHPVACLDPVTGTMQPTSQQKRRTLWRNMGDRKRKTSFRSLCQ